VDKQKQQIAILKEKWKKYELSPVYVVHLIQMFDNIAGTFCF
jgi:ABC-type oligopeptide transport system ATPase subunit